MLAGVLDPSNSFILHGARKEERTEGKRSSVMRTMRVSSKVDKCYEGLSQVGVPQVQQPYQHDNPR
jgi:hypothetical protein